MQLETRVLITGGTGFLGSHLCERLLAGGAVILCVTIFSPGHVGTSNTRSVIRISTDQTRCHLPALCAGRSDLQARAYCPQSPPVG
jgi:UDP-glucuronate decarboxylase